MKTASLLALTTTACFIDLRQFLGQVKVLVLCIAYMYVNIHLISNTRKAMITAIFKGVYAIFEGVRESLLLQYSTI